MVNAIVKPSELLAASEVFPTDAFLVDDGAALKRATAAQIVDAGRPNATEAEALAGTDNFKRMSPLRVRQAVDEVVGGFIGAIGGPYGSREEFEASTVFVPVTAWSILQGGIRLDYVRDDAGTAITSANGVKGSPAGVVTALHWAVNTTPGTTDMSAAFQAAATWLASKGGGDIVCPKAQGPFAVDTVDLTGGVSIVGDAEFRPIGAGTSMFTANGVVGAPVSLTADALRNGNAIPVASTAGFVADEYLILTDEVSYTTTDASYKNGEMVRVKAVTSGTVLTLYGSILGPMGTGNYTVANGAKIRKVSLAAQSRVEGISIAGDWNSTKMLVLMSNVFAPVVSDIRVTNHGHMAIRINGCVNAQVTGNAIRRLRDNLGGGNVGYGISFSGPCLGGIASKNQTDYCRHGFTTQGNAYGYPRGFKVCDNIDTNSTVASFDTHAAGSDWEMSGNLSLNSAGAGITIRAPRGRVFGNKVVRCGSAGIQGVEENISDITIQSNELVAVGAVGIQVPVSCPNLRIVANVILRCNNRAIRVFSSSSTPSGDLVITDNLIEGFAQTAAVEGIVTGGTYTNVRAIIARNTLKAGAGTPTYAIRTVMLDNSDVFNNFAQGTYSTAAYDLGTNVSTSNLTRV